MILVKPYNRERAVNYAEAWALRRNPLFLNFAGRGGDCTNFVSQCVLAGSCVMNFAPVFGWFYLSSNRRAPAWTGVEFFYNFMTENVDVGPYGIEIPIEDAQIGDVIQLQNDDGVFYHTIIISKIEDGEIYICANSNDALDKPLSEYNYASLRVIHILGVRFDTRFQIDCFDSLYSPPLPPIEQSEDDLEPSPQSEGFEP